MEKMNNGILVLVLLLCLIAFEYINKNGGGK